MRKKNNKKKEITDIVNSFVLLKNNYQFSDDYASIIKEREELIKTSARLLNLINIEAGLIECISVGGFIPRP
jgi:hypothetical protein